MEETQVNENESGLDRRGRHPKILVGFLVFLALNLLFYGMVIHPGKKGLQEKEERLEVILRDQTISLRRLDAARADKTALDMIRLNLDTFYLDILSTLEERMNPVREEIARLAQHFNVTLNKRTYPAQENADMGVHEFHIRFPLRGQFEDVGNFISQIENSENFLVIDRITLRTSDDNGRLLQLTFDLSTFFCAVDSLDTLMRRRPQG
jgi:hypothetical protein